MTVKEFKCLKIQEKQQCLFDNGVYLISRDEAEYLIDLYQIDSFYTEAYYDKSSMTLIYLRAFSSIDDLYPYWKYINITPLVNESK